MKHRAPGTAAAVVAAAVVLQMVTAASASLARVDGARAAAAKHKPAPLACKLVQRGRHGPCAPTKVEAWYHTEATAAVPSAVPSGILPSPSQVLPTPSAIPSQTTEPPAVNPYESRTLHVGIVHGAEESRTYLTFATHLGAKVQVTGGKLVVAVDGARSSNVAHAAIEACYVPKPPKKSQEGSFGNPPAVDCSFHSWGRYHKKPRPYLTFDLTPFATVIGSRGGVVLLPSGKAAHDQQTWHLETFARTNHSKRAMRIGASLEVYNAPPPPSPPPLTAPAPKHAGSGGGGLGPASRGGLGATGPTLGGGTGGGGSVTASGGGGSARPAVPLAAPLAAIRYAGVWALPLVLLAGAGFLGFALTRDVTVRGS